MLERETDTDRKTDGGTERHKMSEKEKKSLRHLGEVEAKEKKEKRKRKRRTMKS